MGEKIDMSSKTMAKYGTNLRILSPIYFDDEFVVVEKKDNSWFMVVSPYPAIPISVSLVPFRQRRTLETNSEIDTPICIFSVPRGGFHNIKRVVHSGRGLKKCGELYQATCEVQGRIVDIGSLSVETFGPDKNW